MKVNINGKWYDAEVTPIHIQLNDLDKENIKKMPKSCYNYICYPTPKEEKKNKIK